MTRRLTAARRSRRTSQGGRQTLAAAAYRYDLRDFVRWASDHGIEEFGVRD